MNKSLLKIRELLKGSMKKIFSLLAMSVLLSGCVESMALIGPATTGTGSGKVAQSATSSILSYGVKKQTGKSLMEHALIYAEEMSPQKKKEPCLSFAEKTNSEICDIAKKQLKISKSKISKKSKERSMKDLTSSLQSNINKKSKINYLD